MRQARAPASSNEAHAPHTLDQAESITGADTATIRRFKQFAVLSDSALTAIAAQSVVEKIPAGQQLMEIGTRGDSVLFLLTGRLEMTSANGAPHEIEGSSAEADYAISYLQPHRYTVTTSSPAVILRVNRTTLEKYVNERNSSTYDVEEIEAGEQLRDSLLFHELYEGCRSDRLRLPSLPDIAFKVRKAFENKRSDLWSIALIIDSDPAIAAKLIRVANSANYRGENPADTTTGAVIRLGAATTKELVMSFAMRELFNTRSATLNQRMHSLWKHSIDIAATCFVVAGRTADFEPETALLAGLLEYIGAIAIISYAEKYPEITDNSAELERVINTLHPHVGGMILHSWGLPENISIVPAASEDWFRCSTHTPDYCALVMFAKLLNRLRRDQHADALPPIHELPCLAALGFGDLTVESTLAMAATIKDQIDKMRRLLNT